MDRYDLTLDGQQVRDMHERKCNHLPIGEEMILKVQI
jgi:hypothetical protein